MSTWKAVLLDEASLARTAALVSAGLTLAMESYVPDDIDAGRLVRVLEDWTPTLLPLSLYYPSRRNPTAAFKAFIDFARRHGGRAVGDVDEFDAAGRPFLTG